ncbi:thioredoxin domain-containing protein [Nitratidesulfovibrio sp.]|uniref:DsbA family protein n=1 Tax=Nitratidesulfovibrio sp. TaxID=2802297 RepID=UPI00333F4651
MLRTLFIALLLALTLAATSAIPAPAQAASNEELKAALRDLLKENPELIMQVLRDNSETVLEIAQQGSNVRRKKALISQWQVDQTQPKKANLEGRPMRGPTNAPVTIIAYSDFTCPYCQQAAGTMELLLANYKDKVRYVFKHMPLDSHDNARLAAEYHVAAGMQDGKKAWAFYETVFRDREKLVAEGESFLKKAAAEAGLDMKRLAQDIKGKKVKDSIEEDMAEARALNVQGTPYFLVNDLVIRGSLPLDLFSDAVDMALEAAAKTKK